MNEGKRLKQETDHLTKVVEYNTEVVEETFKRLEAQGDASHGGEENQNGGYVENGSTQRPQAVSRTQRRLAVALIPSAVVLAATFVYIVSLQFTGYQSLNTPQWENIAGWDFLISFDPPPATLVLLAVGVAVGIGVIAVLFEIATAFLTLHPKSKKPPMRATENPHQSKKKGTYTQKGHVSKVTAVIPAHDEAETLPSTLLALAEQTHPPDEVVIICDNCTDDTEKVAQSFHHTIFRTVNNSDKKAGALNQALRTLLPDTIAGEVFLIMDADTKLSPKFVETAITHMGNDPTLAAVGGMFYGDPGCGVVGQLQRNEYTRYALQLKARRGRVFVLTGTASIFRTPTLSAVAHARGTLLPGEEGDVYDATARTEDNELTLALKTLGETMTSLPECQVTTEIMPTWKNLWTQRKRWQRGALENLSTYGLTLATMRYWGQQVGIGYGTFALNLAMILFAVTLLSVNQWIWFPFWLFVGILFLTERVITTWRAGWKGRTLAATLFPEIVYDQFLQAAFLKSLYDILTGKDGKWGHLNPHQQNGKPPATSTTLTSGSENH